jgi:MFS family permease
MEVAPEKKRGLYVSLQFATQQASTLGAGLMGLLLSRLMSPAMLADLGWRIAMLVGVAIVPLGLVLRRSMPETLTAPSGMLLPRLTRRQLGLALLSILMMASITVSTYVMNYMTTFGNYTLGLEPAKAFGAIVATGLCGSLFNPVGGMLADRFGARRVIMIAMPALLIATVPVFLFMAALKTAPALYAGAAVLAVLLALGTPSVLMALSEGLPAAGRSGAIAIVYALAVSIFGGSAQFVVAWLTGVLHSPLAPGFYMSGMLAIGIIARLLLPSA